MLCEHGNKWSDGCVVLVPVCLGSARLCCWGETRVSELQFLPGDVRLSQEQYQFFVAAGGAANPVLWGIPHKTFSALSFIPKMPACNFCFCCSRALSWITSYQFSQLLSDIASCKPGSFPVLPPLSPAELTGMDLYSSFPSLGSAEQKRGCKPSRWQVISRKACQITL